MFVSFCFYLQFSFVLSTPLHSRSHWAQPAIYLTPTSGSPLLPTKAPLHWNSYWRLFRDCCYGATFHCQGPVWLLISAGIPGETVCGWCAAVGAVWESRSLCCCCSELLVLIYNLSMFGPRQLSTYYLTRLLVWPGFDIIVIICWNQRRTNLLSLCPCTSLQQSLCVSHMTLTYYAKASRAISLFNRSMP